MPFPLPNEVLQGLGLAPPPSIPMPPPIPPIDSSLAGAPQDQPPPPVAPPPLAPPPISGPEPVLPSMAAPQSTAPEQNKDFQVPVGAFGHGGPPAPQPPQSSAPHPRAPATPDAQMDRAQQKQSQADADAANAIVAKRDAEVNLARDELAANHAYDEQAALIEKQRKAQQEESVKIHAQKAAFVDATMKAVDDYKVDQNKYMHDMGVGKHIGWYIAMAMSGLGEALQGRGGNNPAVQMLQQKMHDSVVAQIDERDQLKSKNERAQHALDKYDQFSKDRQAQISLMDAQNEKRLANMLREAAAKAKEPMAQANALNEAGKLEQSSAEKAQKSAEFASTNAVAKSNLQVAQGQLGVSRANAIEANRHNLATEENAEQMRLNESLKLERQGKNDEAKLIRERAIGGEVVPIKDASGKVIGSRVQDITTKDGKTWVPKGTEPVVTDFQKGHEAGMRLLSTIDEIRRLGPEFLSNTANSNKLQQLKQQMSDARLEAIKYHGLGVPTGHDVELAEGSVGTSDPTRWKDSMGGLNKSRESIIRNMNISMKERGLDKPWEGPPDPLKTEEHAQTSTEQLQTSLKTKPDENRERVWQATYAQTLKSGGGDITAAKRAADQAMAEAGAIAPKQRADLEALKAQAVAGDAEALAAIQDVAKTGGSATIKRMATEALSEIRSGAQPASPPLPQYDNAYDPNGYNPAALINRFHAPVQPTITPRTMNASNP